MTIKSVFIVSIVVLFLQCIEFNDSKPVLNQSTKRVKCFNPSKPEDMPQDVYDKYLISSRHLAEKDRKDHWKQFLNWWQKVFAIIGNFFKKIGKFIENLFANKKSKNKTTLYMTTEAPPTPSPSKLRKGMNKLVCVEYDENPNAVQTTNVYEIDLTTALPTAMDQWITTTSTTKRSTSSSMLPSMTTTPNSHDNEIPVNTPYIARGDHIKKGPGTYIGFDLKISNGKSDPTVVKGV